MPRVTDASFPLHFRDMRAQSAVDLVKLKRITSPKRFAVSPYPYRALDRLVYDDTRPNFVKFRHDLAEIIIIQDFDLHIAHDRPSNMQTTSITVKNLLLLSRTSYLRVEARVSACPIRNLSTCTCIKTGEHAQASSNHHQICPGAVPLAWAYPWSITIFESTTSRRPRSVPEPLRQTTPYQTSRTMPPSPQTHHQTLLTSPFGNCSQQQQQPLPKETSIELQLLCKIARFRPRHRPPAPQLLSPALPNECRRCRLRPCRLDSRGSALVRRTCGAVHSSKKEPCCHRRARGPAPSGCHALEGMLAHAWKCDYGRQVQRFQSCAVVP